ncbi:MAG: peroxidase family protein, partial [Acidobacteriota bacterium]
MPIPKNIAPLAFRLSLVALVAVNIAGEVRGQASPGVSEPLPPSEEFPTSPVRRVERALPAAVSPPAPDGFRTLDGTGNNVVDPEMGAAGARLVRFTEVDYGDGVSTLAGADRPSARAVSNAVCAQSELMPNALGVSDFIWQWGQFLDHDLSLTEGVDPAEPANILVPAGDIFFDPTATGAVTMDFNRSIYDPTTGSGAGAPRQQINEITSWIDASNVYGSEDERAHALRALDGTGRLATSDGDFLPFNTAGLPNAGGASSSLFLAGDVRANEQVGLAAMHTLFVREHNRLADGLRVEEPDLTGDEIYERVRRIVGAQMQVITYREFLPALLGPGALRPYQGYRDGVDATIANDFSTAAYRFGHSTLS